MTRSLACRNSAWCGKPRAVGRDLCMECVMHMGPHKYDTTSRVDCCVCFEPKHMVTLQCAHELCNDCWFTVCQGVSDPLCPICRQANVFQ